MRVRGQSSLEWLMAHAWSIMVVLSVSAVLFYAGVFEAVARPRFEGLDAAGLRPIPEQVQLYSDGVLVFTVLNTRPYSYTLEWVEVAPIANREDVIRTNLNAVLRTNQLGVFEVNASNLLGSIMEASIVSLQDASAQDYVSFHIRYNESHSGGGKPTNHTAEGKGINILYIPEPSAGNNPCNLAPPGWTIPCESDASCPLNCHWCSGAGSPEAFCGDNCGNDPANCDPEAGPGEVCKCVSTEDHPLGTCMTCPAS